MDEYIEYQEDVRWHFFEIMLSLANETSEDEITPELYDDASNLLVRGFIDKIEPKILALELVRTLGLLPKVTEMQ